MPGKKHHQILNKRTVFSKGPVHLVECRVRTPHGKILSRHIIEHPGCVVIAPKTKSGKFILVRQYRFPLDGHLWEFPAGGREPRETFATAAKRELMEEIGMRPKRLKELVRFYPTPGVSGEKMHLFLASDLIPKSAPKDEDEEFEVRAFSLGEIERMIRSRKIVDGKTIIGFFYLKGFRLKS